MWVDGTPPKQFYKNRLIDRQISEMLGLVKGVICDGVVADAEVISLKQWLASNPDLTSEFPFNVLAERIVATFEDGVIDEDEREDLKDMLFNIVGEPEDLTGSMNEPTTLPFDDPPPTLFFDSKEYVFSGIFAHGPRAKLIREITDRAGFCGRNITLRTDVLGSKS